MRGLPLHLLNGFGDCAPQKDIATPLNVQVPAVIEPTLFDISPN